MTLIALLDAHLAFGLLPLLDGAAAAVAAGERVGLIGRNGTGKSSLLAVLAARQALDDGQIKRKDGLRTVVVEQEPVLPPAQTLRDSLILRGGLDSEQDAERRLALDVRLTEYLQRFGVDPDRSPDVSSGGERKRAALALAFALDPELLLLDEPTNHLDIESIELLEQTLAKGPASVVVTHDRRFLDRVTTRILELDRGVLRSYAGNFGAYEKQKTAQLAAESVANRHFDKFWAQEEAWIRKGVEARRTRNEGRVKRLESLREQRSARRERLGSVRMAIDAGERSGKLVAELDDVGKAFGDRVIVASLSMRLMRGDRLGLIGRNGAGKSTLIRLMLGELAPDRGTVRLGTNLRVAYFDQLRAQLDPGRTVAETISPGSDWIDVNGQRKHIASYLADFLFPARRAQSPVRMLSGGERNRLLLARLFAQPANLLVLDEPTNDLDMESLELLESTLQDYAGTLILVSHDREFLDNVVTQTLATENAGEWREYVGGYSDYLAQREGARAGKQGTLPDPTLPLSAAARDRKRVRISYKQQREIEALPGEIEQLEQERDQLAALMSSADYHRTDAAEMRRHGERTAQIEQQIAARLDRWEALEALAARAE